MNPEIRSLQEMLRQSAAQFGGLPAVRFHGTTTTYAELDAAADRTAHLLQAAGVERGGRVGLYCINSPFFAAAYFGIVRAGAVVVPVNLLLSPGEVEYILRHAEASALIYHEAFEAAVRAVRPAVGSLRATLSIGAQQGAADHALLPVMQEGDRSHVEHPVDLAEDLAVIMYTSGTTGQPKGAMLTHRNLLSNVDSVRAMLEMGPGDTIITVLPMFHAFAATACMLTGLRVGAQLAAVPRFLPDELSQVIEREQGTVFMGVPSMYAVLADLPAERSPDFSHLRLCVSGGAALPAEVMRRFEQRYGVPIYEGDGPTECSPVTSINPIGGVRKVGSIGRPVPSVEMRIVDDQGAQLPVGQVGEIVVRGPNVMKGYWRQPEATAEAFLGEWFRTGDVGHVDQDGYFYIVDRKKDMIIVNGMNVYPRHVEEVIYQHPAVAECAVVAEPDTLHGEIPKAVIAFRAGKSATPSELRRWCLQHLGRYQVPRIWEVRDQLPKNATGKILKRELTRRGEAERGIDQDGPAVAGA